MYGFEISTGAVDHAPMGRRIFFIRYPARWAGLKDSALLVLELVVA